jgi:hypothetical protein
MGGGNMISFLIVVMALCFFAWLHKSRTFTAIAFGLAIIPCFYLEDGWSQGTWIAFTVTLIVPVIMGLYKDLEPQEEEETQDLGEGLWPNDIDLIKLDGWDRISRGLELLANPDQLAKCRILFYTSHGEHLSRADTIVVTPKKFATFYVNFKVFDEATFKEASIIDEHGNIISTQPLNMNFKINDNFKFKYEWYT